MSLIDQLTSALVTLSLLLTSITGGVNPQSQVAQVSGSVTPAFVQKTNSFSDSAVSSVALPSINVTAGNFIAVFVKHEGSATSISISDSQGNTYTPLTKNSDFDLYGQWFYAKNIKSGNTGITVTLSSPQPYIRAVALEYSGIDTVSPFDKETNNLVSSGTSLTTSSITSAGAYVALTGVGEYNIQTYTSASPWVERWDCRQENSGCGGTAVSERINPVSETFGGSMTQSTSAKAIVNLAVFKASQSQTPSDTTAPTTPTSLSASAVSSSQVNLTWSPSTDAVGVTGYKIYRGGTQIGTATTNSYSDTGLSANTTYSYTVSAYDGAGNNSSQSTSASATTQAVSVSAPTISSFSSSPTSITSGQSTTLSWSTTNATSLSISGIGTVTGTSVSVSPTQTTTYTLTATNSSGSVTANTTVTVSAPVQSGSNITATSCSQSDVQTAINNVTSGGTVTVPAGSCTWAGVAINKPVHLKGSGVGVTNITLGSGNSITKQSGGVIRISNFSFTKTGGGNESKGFDIGGSWRNAEPVVIENNSFVISNSGLFHITVAGGVIIAKNSFTGDWDDSFIQPKDDQDSGNSWGTVDTLGNKDTAGKLNIYVEENTFYGGTNQGIDCDDSSRCVYRYNTLTYSSFNSHGWDTSPKGVRHFEVYNNTIKHLGGTSQIANQNWGVWIRGGTGVIFNNQIDNIAGSYWGDKPELKFSIRGAEDVRPQGACSSVSYPVPRQVGQNHNGTSYFTDPIYIWGNTGSQTIGAGWDWGNPCGLNFSTFWQSGRDYVVGTAKPNYTPYTYPHPLRTGSSTPPPSDTTAPSVPTGLSASAVSSSAINLSWSPSTDAVGVTGYKIYRNGTQIGTATTNSYSDTGLNPSTTYSYTVSAYDGAGNNSTQSSSVNGTTQVQQPTGSLIGGVIDPSRAIDWSTAGVEGGIPSASWTQCGATIPAGSSASTIQTAINNCGTNQYVKLGAGTFNLTTGLVMKSNMAIRGMGADQTKLVFSGVNGCNGLWGAVCMAGANEYYGSSQVQPGGSQSATWTGGFAKGTTNITLTGVGSNGIKVGQYIYLDQNNDVTTNNGFFVCEKMTALCSDEGGAGDPGRVVGGVARQQIQIVKVVAINGNTYTISPGLYNSNWSSTYSPGAWWASSSVTRSGVEDLSLDISGTGTDTNTVVMMNANNVWVTGSRLVKNCVNCSRNQVWMWQTARATVKDNYFYGQTGQSVSYGVESYMVSDSLISNNIFQHTPAPMLLHSNTGSVYSYNFTINNTYDDGRLPKYHWQIQSIVAHSAGVSMNLMEGNVGNGIGGDAIHGNPVLNTVFRNYLHGRDPNRIDNTNPLMFEAYNRYWNVVGNVLGTPGYHNSYSSYNSTSIFLPGAGRGSIPDDPVVTSTMLRWGNYDTVNNAVRWNASEVPSTLSQYANPVPSTQTLPASLYLTSKPSWFGNVPWPPIGPDVSGGNIAGLGGRAYKIPAQLCYESMGGPADGTGNPLNFNASTCYSGGSVVTPPPSDTTAPTTPTGLSASVISSSQVNLTWSPSTDAVGVTGYKIYRGGVQIGTATTNSYSDTGLSANTTYSYTVSAYDGAGNNSSQSTAVSATTQAVLPVISNLVGSNITTSSITISWDTNVPTNGQVFYGLTTNYGSQSALLDNTTKTTTHSTTLSGLTAGTTYNFKVTSVDALGNTTSSANFSFTTGPATPTDVTAPTISAITASAITTSGATISWTTNENSDTQVEYGLTTSYGSQTTLNTTLLTNHSATLSGLTASTTYHYRVKSKDASGNLAVSSDQTLTTLPLPDTTAPVISNVVISSVTANSATVTWTTNENSDTQVDYGTTASYGLQTTRNTTLATTHSASITNLSSGVTYNLRVRSTDASGNIAVSSNYTFTTTTPAPPQDTTAPVISSITTSNLTTSSIQVGWNTDESASGYVNYGTTASYGLTSSVDSTLKTSRTIGLSNLKRNTTYNYQVVSTDASGNIGRSTNRTFTTPNRLPKPPKTTTLTAINGSVILTWSDPVDTDNQVYELWRGVLIMRSTTGFIQVPDKSTALADVPSTTKTYRDTTVTTGTTYYYSVFTYDDQGTYSDPAYITFTPTEATQTTTGGGATAGGSSSTSGTPSGSAVGGAPASTPTIVVFIPKSSPLASTTPTVIQTPNLTIILITKTMSRGSKIAEVKTLQQFLISQGYLPANTPLGNYGPMTEQAVKAFQKKQGIVSSGSPATTGYGMVGAKTRAVINALLQKQTPTATQTSSTTETPEQTLARLQALLKQLQQLQGQR